MVCNHHGRPRASREKQKAVPAEWRGRPPGVPAVVLWRLWKPGAFQSAWAEMPGRWPKATPVHREPARALWNVADRMLSHPRQTWPATGRRYLAAPLVRSPGSRGQRLFMEAAGWLMNSGALPMDCGSGPGPQPGRHDTADSERNQMVEQPPTELRAMTEQPDRHIGCRRAGHAVEN